MIWLRVGIWRRSSLKKEGTNVDKIEKDWILWRETYKSCFCCWDTKQKSSFIQYLTYLWKTHWTYSLNAFIFTHKYRSGICLRPLSSGSSSMMVRVLKLFFVLICFHFISSHSHIGVIEEDRDANDGIKIDFIYVDQAGLTMVQYHPQVSWS